MDFLKRHETNKKRDHIYSDPLTLLAGPMGLEPTPSGVTGRRYNQLNYDPANLSILKSSLFSIGEISFNFPGRRNRT